MAIIASFQSEVRNGQRLAEDRAKLGFAVGLDPLKRVVDIACLKRAAPVGYGGAVGGFAMSEGYGDDGPHQLAD